MIRAAFQSFAFDSGARAIPSYSARQTSTPALTSPHVTPNPAATLVLQNPPPTHQGETLRLNATAGAALCGGGPDRGRGCPGRARPHLHGPGPPPRLASPRLSCSAAAPLTPPPCSAPPGGLPARPLPAPLRLSVLTPSSSSSSEPASSGWSRSMSNTPAMARV